MCSVCKEARKSSPLRNEKVLKAITLKEIERIFTVTDAMGISREALVIPLRTETPGRLKMLPDGKLEIVVEKEGDFEDWLSRLEPEIRALMNPLD
jgi:hypothetical protein